MARKTPGLNTQSTADIAFLLLCYFLMTSTMDQQSGLQRRLPPMPDQNQKTEDTKVNKRDNNNVFDFLESEGYIRLKADMSVTSKELYAIYGIWCDENGLTPIRQRSFSDFLMRNLKTYNLEHTNTVTNATGRRVWGYLGIEPLISPHISENWGKSLCTYVLES